MRSVFQFLLAAAATVAASDALTTPEKVTLAFFDRAGFPEKKSYYTGEMHSYSDQPTLGESLPVGVQVTTRALLQTHDRSVQAVDMSKDRRVENWYVYLANESGWKIEAVRTLALTGVPAMLLEQLRAQGSRSPEEEWTMRNLSLVFTSDHELKELVRRERAALDSVATAVRDGRGEEATAAARALFISSVKGTATGNVELIIGGIVDNSVGLMFVPQGNHPPKMDPAGYIYVEPVVGGWFVYKTT